MKNLTLPKSILTKNQKKQYGWKEYQENGHTYRIKAIIRHDDDCGNGHNSFSITGTIEEKRGSVFRDYSGGCIHNQIEKHFPELRPYIKWHLCSTDSPMHYVANTLYHASDKDCWGLRKGERKQIVNGKTGKPCWILEGNTSLEKYVEADTRPQRTVILNYVPWERVGEGKEIDIEAARSSAIWPEATLEQLQNKELLIARLPALMEEFKKDVESLGLVY